MSSTFLEEESSEILLFGDIFIVCFNNKNEIIDFSVSDYGILYEELYEGFDDCFSESSENYEDDSDEDDDIKSFINDEELNISSDDNYNELLDYDTNDYSSSSEEEN